MNGPALHPIDRLLPRMLPRIDVPRPLLRGLYGWASTSMEQRGIPIDVPMIEHLKNCWQEIQAALVAEVDRRYGVFEGTTFKREKFANWLMNSGIPWPRRTVPLRARLCRPPRIEVNPSGGR